MTTWSEFSKNKKYPPLSKDISADVIIIGGGITGVLNAYKQAKAGRKVVLIEEKEIGAYATLATTAFITKVIDSELKEIISLFGEDIARKVWESGQRAVDEFEKIIKEENIECEFSRCNNYIFASTKKQSEELKDEYEAYQKFGIESWLTDGKELNFKNHGSLIVPNQAKFHVAKFLYALAEKARNLGAEIYENTSANDIRTEGDELIVETEKINIITAKNAIIATYKPIINKKTHLKKGMYRSYVFEVKVPKGTFKDGIYEDQSNPYHYFRIDRNSDGEYDRMIVGGEDHKDIFGETLKEESFKGLEKFLAKIMEKRSYAITKKWQGPILEPSDGLSLIGEIIPHVYVATAFSGNGMTYSMISALMFEDMLMGRTSSWEEAYSPKRSLFHPQRLAVKAKDYVQEFFGGAFKNLLS